MVRAVKRMVGMEKGMTHTSFSSMCACVRGRERGKRDGGWDVHYGRCWSRVNTKHIDDVLMKEVNLRS
jgi:hypothetical protein